MACGHRCTITCHRGQCSTSETCKKKIILRCPCKRQKKDIQCFMQSRTDLQLLCDDECTKLQASIAAEKQKNDLRLKEEKEKEQIQELQEFLRKTEGKKRRKKKTLENDLSSSKCTTNMLISSFAVLCMSSLLAFYFLKW